MRICIDAFSFLLELFIPIDYHAANADKLSYPHVGACRLVGAW